MNKFEKKSLTIMFRRVISILSRKQQRAQEAYMAYPMDVAPIDPSSLKIAVDPSALKVAGSRYIGQIEMPVQDWIDVSDCHVQRDTEHRVARAKHLFTLKPSHLHVAMAVRKGNGRKTKVDGHSRALIWFNTLCANGAMPRCDKVPSKVFVDVYETDSEEAEKSLYDTYDQSEASKNASDLIFGAIRQENLQFNTAWLARGGFKSAVERASSMLGVGSNGKSKEDYARNAVRIWSPELLVLDKIGPTRYTFIVPVLIACLWSQVLYGREIICFWDALNRDEGVKSPRGKDVVQLATEYLGDIKAKKIHGATAAPEIVRRMITYATRYVAGPDRLRTKVQELTDEEYNEMRQEIAEVKHLK